MRVNMGSINIMQLRLHHTARCDIPQAHHCARVSGKSTLQDAWAKRSVREWLTMPGSACFLQKAGLLLSGNL